MRIIESLLGLNVLTSRRVNDIISRPSGITPSRNDYKISVFICTHFTRKAVDCILHQLPCLGGVGDGGDEQTLQQTYSPKEVQVAFKVLMTR